MKTSPEAPPVPISRSPKQGGCEVAWTRLFHEDFEGNLPGWQFYRYSTDYALVSWAKTSYQRKSGASSLYCASGFGEGVPAPGPYPPDVAALALTPVVNLASWTSSREEVYVEFWVWYQTQDPIPDPDDPTVVSVPDYFRLGIFAGGNLITSYTVLPIDSDFCYGRGESLAGTVDGWHRVMAKVPVGYRVDGLSFVLLFVSDGSVELEGAYVDDFSIWATSNMDTCRVTDDYYSGRQWNLENTRQIPTVPASLVEHADMQVLEAWDLVEVSNDIKIAIVDKGVDLEHPDLNVIPGWDPQGGVGAPVPDGPNNAHGTLCAGVAGAIPENGIGIVGVAPGVTILPVRGTDAEGKLEGSALYEGLIWAVDNGATVISCSWGAPESATIEQAFRYATQNGVVSFCGVGNFNIDVFFPATLTADPSIAVVAVGGSSPCDERKDLASCGGRNPVYPGSCYDAGGGVGPDVMAPSQWVYSTDLTGTAGWNSGQPGSFEYGIHGDYSGRFGGTSSATPMAAGVAALLLSKCPCLTPHQIKAILRDTADPIGPVNEVGQGRINAYEALLSVEGCCSDAPDLACTGLEYEWAAGNLRADVDIVNLGTVASEEFSLSMLLDGGTVATVTVPALAPSETFQWQPEYDPGPSGIACGSHSLEVVVDPLSGPDSSAANNVCSTVLDALPDLTCSPNGIVCECDGLREPPHSATVEVTLENAAPCALESAFALVVLWDGEEIYRRADCPPLGAWQTHRETLSFSRPECEQGMHALEVRLDPDDLISEDRDDNNLCTKSVEVVCSCETLPDLAPAICDDWPAEIFVTDSPDSDIPRAFICVGSPVYVTSCLANLGPGVAPSFGYTIHVDGVPLILDVADGPLEPGFGIGVSESLGTFPPGEHVVEVICDPNGTLAECSEQNNRAGIRFWVCDSAELGPALFQVEESDEWWPDVLFLAGEEDIMVATDWFCAGGQVYANFGVGNFGCADAPPFQVELQVDGRTVLSIPTSQDIPPGFGVSWQNVLLPAWAREPGEHTVCVRMDLGDPETVEECISGDENNQVCRSYSVVDLPDLEVGSAFLSSQETASEGRECFQPDDPVYLHCSLVNSGCADSEACSVRVQAEGNTIATVPQGPLAVGASEEHSILLPVGDPGEFTISLEIDSNQELEEIHEDNNTWEGTLRHSATPPDLGFYVPWDWPSKLAVTTEPVLDVESVPAAAVQSVKCTDTVYVHFCVANSEIDSCSVPSFQVELLLDWEAHDETDDYPVEAEPALQGGDLDGGYFQPFLNVEIPNPGPSLCRLVLRVDPDHAVEEGTKEGNNCFEQLLSVSGFIRGNCSPSLQPGPQPLDLTDGIFLLERLFLLPEEPICKDACDTNDDGRLNMTDAIYVFNFLFLGGPAPPAPFPECGTDPTPDDLSCGLWGRVADNGPWCSRQEDAPQMPLLQKVLGPRGLFRKKPPPAQGRERLYGVIFGKQE